MSPPLQLLIFCFCIAHHCLQMEAPITIDINSTIIKQLDLKKKFKWGNLDFFKYLFLINIIQTATR